MNCQCGNSLTTIDELESERVRVHKTMCNSCRADYMEFHEAEAETDEILMLSKLQMLAKSVERSVGKFL